MEKEPVKVDPVKVLDENCSAYSPIINFYTGKSIFITGATGFAGLALVEKLLFTCSDINKIYILIKPKGNKNVEQRSNEYLNNEVFERVRNKHPNALKKIKFIPGNMSEKNLGLSDHDLDTISKEVAIVFHAAADLNFKKSLSDAIIANTKPTEVLCELCKNFKQLQVFVFVSTAYSNSNRRLVLEEVDKEPFSTQILNYLLEEVSDTNNLKSYLADRRPNGYSYSKTLAEMAVNKYNKYYPTVIVRPSVVISAISDPHPGWLFGWNGVNAVIAGVCTGVLRCWSGEPGSVADLIPVDTVVNLLIAVPWDSQRPQYKDQRRKTKVFNCCSGLRNPISVEKFMRTCLEQSKLINFKNRFLTPSLILTGNSYLCSVLWFLLCTVPAYIMDGVYRLMGGKLSMVKYLEILKKLQDVFKYFTLKEFAFVDLNMKQLYEEMCELDQQIFNFDVRSFDWDTYLKDYVSGIQKLTMSQGPLYF